MPVPFRKRLEHLVDPRSPMIADYRGGVTCLYDTQFLGACLHAPECGGRSRPQAVRGMPEVPIGGFLEALRFGFFSSVLLGQGVGEFYPSRFIRCPPLFPLVFTQNALTGLRFARGCRSVRDWGASGAGG